MSTFCGIHPCSDRLIFELSNLFFILLGNILPGEKGGGQLPDFATASLQSLIPTDLTAVSVFNFVFASARTLSAEAVIFSEIQDIKNLTDASTFGREQKKEKTRPKYLKKGKRSARLGKYAINFIEGGLPSYTQILDNLINI